MKNTFNKFKHKTRSGILSSLLPLLLIMTAIGLFTAFAAANTYEVVTRNDTPYARVITGVDLTTDKSLGRQYTKAYHHDYNEGSFGKPYKVRFPEQRRHIDIIKAQYDKNWKASKGLGQTFLTDNERQKAFGEAVIYIRTNTSTIRNVGEFYTEDIINVVTTEGWQLGFKVVDVSNDPVNLANSSGDKSEIIVILIDEQTGDRVSFRAELHTVGERL